MSQLRICRPGHPVNPADFIDLGPSVGRRSFTRGSIYGGVLVTAQPFRPLPVAATSEARREQMKEYREARVVACGYVMPKLGEACARRKGHSPENDHRSRRNLEAIARRRWATV